MSSSERLRRPACAVLLFLLGACTPPIRQYDLKDQPLTCDEANRYAFETLKGMGFKIGTFTPATAGEPGRIKGVRDEIGPGSSEQKVTVEIRCGGAGATIDASEDGKLLGQIDFKRAFYISFLSVRDTARARAEMAARQASGTAPSSLQRKDLQVLVEPVAGSEARLDFAIDIAAAGILPVRIRISNLTPRRYTLDPAEIKLTRADRERVGALSVEQAAQRIAGARHLESGAPVTTLSPDAVGALLRDKLFTAKAIEPGSEAKGFLYFPAADYKRARVVLTEEESGETEGVAVEF